MRVHTRFVRCLAAFGILAGPAVARAQAVPSAAPARQPSPVVAEVIAAATTVFPLAGLAYNPRDRGTSQVLAPILIGTFLFGPIAGYAYGGVFKQGLAPAGRRALVALATAGLASALCSGDQCGLFDKESNADIAATVGLVGGVTLLVMTVRDIGHVRTVVREHNARRLSLFPVVRPGERGAGFVVSLSY